MEMTCVKCGEQMKLILSEPRRVRFELMTFSCVACEAVESFLMAI
jgi:hypothetical protein